MTRPPGEGGRKPLNVGSIGPIVVKKPQEDIVFQWASCFGDDDDEPITVYVCY